MSEEKESQMSTTFEQHFDVMIVGEKTQYSCYTGIGAKNFLPLVGASFYHELVEILDENGIEIPIDSELSKKIAAQLTADLQKKYDALL